MKKSILKNTLILVAITLAAALCLAVVYAVTKNRIAEVVEKERIESYHAVFEQMADHTPLSEDIITKWNEERKGGADIVTASFAKDADGKVIGIVVSAVSHDGYGGDITLSVGVDNNGVITGMKVTAMSETSGLGAEWQKEENSSKFKGKKSADLKVTKTGAKADDEIDAVSGATKSSNAVVSAVNEGYEFAVSQLRGDNVG